MYRLSKSLAFQASKAKVAQGREISKSLSPSMNFYSLSLRNLVNNSKRCTRIISNTISKQYTNHSTSGTHRRSIFTKNTTTTTTTTTTTNHTLKQKLNPKKSPLSSQSQSQSIHTNRHATTSNKCSINSHQSIKTNRNKLNPTQVIHNISKRQAGGGGSGGGGLEPIINNPYTGITHAAAEDDFLHPSMGYDL